MTVSGARNSENGSAIFLEPETDVMVQFLAPEIVIMVERNFMSPDEVERSETSGERSEPALCKS